MKSYSDNLPEFDKVKNALQDLVRELGDIVKEQNEQTQQTINNTQKQIVETQNRKADTTNDMVAGTLHNVVSIKHWVRVAVWLGVFNLAGLAGIVAWYLHHIGII